MNAFVERTLVEVRMARDRSNPVGTRRQQQKAETRALILDAARYLFEARGYDGTTVRAVATRAGVGLGTIFNHFPDKESLAIAALLDDLSALGEQAMGTIPADATPREQLMHMARQGYATWGRRPELSRVLLKQMWFSRAEGARELREAEELFRQRAALLCEAAMKRGKLRADLDPALATRAVFSLYLTTLMEELERPRFDLDAALERLEDLVDLLLDGIGPAT